jgi:hypothetical protein
MTNDDGGDRLRRVNIALLFRFASFVEWLSVAQLSKAELQAEVSNSSVISSQQAYPHIHTQHC